MTQPYRIYASNGSPYSQKFRAVLRYKKIPYEWVLRTPDTSVGEPASSKPSLLPTVFFPHDSSFRTDSTPMVYEIEKLHPDAPSVIPDDPVHGYLCRLIEDFADEWVTKMMYHYRWYYDEAFEYAAQWISDDLFSCPDEGTCEMVKNEMTTRQRSRMELVGCTELTKPIIEGSFHELLSHLKTGVGFNHFLFGSCPSLADFAIVGQLTTLAADPVSQTIMRKEAQAVESWVRHAGDLSGTKGEWITSDEALPETTLNVLKMVGGEFLPFMKANKDAADKGETSLSLTIRGKEYSQAVFKYQLKCYRILKDELALISGDARDRLQKILEDVGCWKYLQ